MLSYRATNGYQTARYNGGLCWSYYSFYPHPLDHSSAGTIHSYRDKNLRDFSLYVRRKNNWVAKSRDRRKFVKWLEKTRSNDYRRHCRYHLAWTRNDIEFAWRELANYRQYVEALREWGFAIEPDIDGVWRGDDIISLKIKGELIAAVATLEDIRGRGEASIPDGTGQVTNLVDPYRWPAVYGRTIDQGTGELLKIPHSIWFYGTKGEQEDVEDSPRIIYDGYSSLSCLLASEFIISKDGDATKISSYIVGLHSPDQQRLFYPILENIFTKSIVLFEHVLADLACSRPGSTRDQGCTHDTQRNPDVEVKPQKARMGILVKDYHRKNREILAQFKSGGPITADYSDDAQPLCWRHRGCQNRGIDCGGVSHKSHVIQIHESEIPLDLKDMWGPPNFSGGHDLRGRNLRVLVQFMTLAVTPEDPVSKDTPEWFMFGNLNESVVAVVTYCYAQENVTEVRLNFVTIHNRQFNAACRCGRSDFSVDQSESTIIKENRVVAFPNLLPRKLESFEIIDKTRGGHLKMLTFYLCDPSLAHEMPTTRIVAPQTLEMLSTPSVPRQNGPH
ncbi:hypothetical protein TWF102_005083 [Orbilia oligospora]|uniref:DUF4246 domain-containing protein n=1 Tax=Orbilia oligospora TaxID=2813651 RepID=A0A7C8NTF6_ORBOL|nr:hypothetical protein TWF102_005083 [Orbilia oligospora]KAF3103939.1 hypothetical protein TWF103_007089 [Orbilia oligospora]KAF3127352.1 hypothetical protein TWF594_000682 [Orbilia oligospora]KAF3141012.1 hypothetical protein TWF703_002519 [Orbilia oligospora]